MKSLRPNMGLRSSDYLKRLEELLPKVLEKGWGVVVKPNHTLPDMPYSAVCFPPEFLSGENKNPECGLCRHGSSGFEAMVFALTTVWTKLKGKDRRDGKGKSKFNPYGSFTKHRGRATGT